MNASANSIGVGKRSRPPSTVATRSKYSMPAGTTSRIDVSE